MKKYLSATGKLMSSKFIMYRDRFFKLQSDQKESLNGHEMQRVKSNRCMYRLFFKTSNKMGSVWFVHISVSHSMSVTHGVISIVIKSASLWKLKTIIALQTGSM